MHDGFHQAVKMPGQPTVINLRLNYHYFCKHQQGRTLNTSVYNLAKSSQTNEIFS